MTNLLTLNIRQNTKQLDIQRLARRLWEIETDKDLVVKVTDKKEKRKEAQSRLQFHWFRELERQSSQTAEYWRAYCKLVYGVPIARESDAFRELYDSTIKGLPFESKIALMKEPMDIPITRTFSVKEMARYLTAIEVEMAEEGYRLSTGDDLYFEALMKDAA